jgi:putative transposase
MFKDDVKKVERTKSIVGIDFGCQTSLTYSDGTKRTVSIGETERLKRLQRKMSKQVKGSNNRNRTKHLVQVEYQKITNRKLDVANKIVSELKQHELVIIQDEQLRNWAKNHHGKVIQHSCFGTIKSKLKQLDNVILLSKDIPTTKLCMNCGKVHDIKLSNRSFTCCEGSSDRDIHAAQNMVEIFDMIQENLNIPPEQRKFKREEFLAAYEKKFGLGYGTLRHEDATFQGCH